MSVQPDNMQGYRYQQGDRPLQGYTIQRAIGRGGFGEVYYALSDSGREVAIKAIQGYEQIELRGVGQCMNLKSPHLVTVFDVKHNADGKAFVVMEYVAGPCLSDLLADAPGGLGCQKAAFFLREIGKGLSFLHDCGIVHRDLKPGNIFYEDGYVKIGDYGLSKAMASSRHDGQTITVGTVHYMAPEIGAGCYDRSIDIYALGVVLFEMLTGNVPYSGSSHGEVLMKHMTADPDLTGVEEPMAGVLGKALAKDPAQRYQTVQEMVEALFGVEHVRNSVSHFRPNSLTVVAGRVAPTVTPTPGPARQAVATPPPAVSAPPSDVKTVTPAPLPVASAVGADPLTRAQRYLLAIVAGVTVALATGILSDPGVLPALIMISGASAGLLAVGQRLRLESESSVVRRLAYGGIATISAFLAVLVLSGRNPISSVALGRLLPALLPLLLVDWCRQMSARRAERMSLGRAFSAGVLAFICSAILGGEVVLAIGVAAGVSLVVQAASPFHRRNITPGTPAPAPAAQGVAGPVAPPGESVSPCKRIWALALAAIFFLPGLHRFYVGKIGTGIIWLLTSGLFGVGQIVDIILIVTGRFRDGQGRRLLVWEDFRELEGLPPPRPARPTVTHVEPRARIVNPLLSAAGALVLLLAMLVALGIAVDIPGMTAGGVFGSDVSREMEEEMGMADWPRLVRDAGIVLTVTLTLLAVVLLVLARKKAGPVHMFRAIVGPFGLQLAAVVLGEALDRIPWTKVAEAWEAGKVGLGIDEILRRADEIACLGAAVLLLASIVILAWPPRQKRRNAGRGVERGPG